MSDTPTLNDAANTAARLATREAVLPMRALSLLGTFGTADALQALLRTPRGNILRVHAGDTVGGDRIAAVESGLVVLERQGKTRVLRMPGAGGASISGAGGS